MPYQTYSLPLRRPQGLRGVLLLILGAVLLVGAVSLLLFVGLAVAVLGLALVSITAIGYVVRRALQNSPTATAPPTDPAPSHTRVIEIESVVVEPRS